MDFGEDEKAAGEILRSLLTTKMDNTLGSYISTWPTVETKTQPENFQTEEHVIWQIEPNIENKQEFVTDSQNIIQQIPLTYMTANDKNLNCNNSRTIVKPITYVLNPNNVCDLNKFCDANQNEGNIILNEQHSIVLVKDLSLNFLKTNDSLQVQENKFDGNFIKILGQNKINTSSIILTNENKEINNGTEVAYEKKEESKIKSLNNDKNNKGIICFDNLLGKNKIIESENNLIKSKGERKTGGPCKKTLRKRKNSKLNKKTLAKILPKKSLKNVKTVGTEKVGDNVNDGEITEKNLFELTKLEDNVNQVMERLKIGCDCADTNCFEGLDPDKVFRHRLNIADLTKAEHDMYLMGVIMASVQNLEETCRHKERIRIRSCYAYQGKKVCLTAFLYLQHVTLYQMKRLRSHLKNHGVSPRIHGNRGRKPANTFSLDIYHCATNFVQNYIEKHCVKSIPNFTTFSFNKTTGNSLSGSNHPVSKIIKKTNKVKIPNKITSYHLPSECTKKTVHKEYKSFCENLKPSQKAMKYSTFTSFLQKQFPNVKFSKIDKKQIVEKIGQEQDGEKLKIENLSKMNRKEEENENQKDNFAQTTSPPHPHPHPNLHPPVLYYPTKTIQVTQKPTLVVSAEQNSRVVYNKSQSAVNPVVKMDEKNLQEFVGGHGDNGGSSNNELQMDFRFSNRVLIDSQIYEEGETSENAEEMYAADNVA